MRGEFCDIKNFKPSYRTKIAIKDVNNVIEMSNYLQTFVSLIPFYQLFSGCSSFNGVGLASSGWNATTYNWRGFSGALNAIPKIKTEHD